MSNRDHPRVCGEKSSGRKDNCGWPGSPPRVRGKGAWKHGKETWVGITPACAGKRVQRISFAPLLWDHPRVCGEKSHSLRPSAVVVGSPPRVRGKD